MFVTDSLLAVKRARFCWQSCHKNLLKTDIKSNVDKKTMFIKTVEK